jgi:hypothetical protein
MAKNKKDRSGKKYVPKGRDHLKVKFEPWRAKLVFDPLESILDELEQQGTLTTSAEGQVMFKDVTTGEWHDTIAALLGVIDTFEILERRYGVDAQLDPLRAFADKIEKGSEIDNRDTAAVRASMKTMRNLVLDMTIGEVRQLVRDFQTKDELEKLLPVAA